MTCQIQRNNQPAFSEMLGQFQRNLQTGVRRAGKSKLLEAFKVFLQQNYADANIIHINFNLSKYDNLKNYKALNEYIESNYSEGKENFVFIDEIQMCDKFELCINNLHATEMYDIYITGSNAFMLSSDLATLFTGRTFEIKVYPFSFSEYVQYYGLTDQYTAFDSYMIEGGMSGSYLYKEQEDKYDYIENVYDTLILRDIRQKYNILDSKKFRQSDSRIIEDRYCLNH